MLDTKKVSKNAFLLGSRTLLTVLIGLYVSRVLLLNLGEVNFGVYSIVGSVIVVWGSLRGVFASSTQRFLNVASVHEDHSYSRRIFSISLSVHLIIAALFLALVGGVGAYLINNTLSIPAGSLSAANIIFWASMLSSVFSIITTPFDASIIAHERMGFFALTSVLDVLGRLLLALSIPLFKGYELIFWGCAYAFLTVLIRIISVIYAKAKCPEVRFKLELDRSLFMEMTRFAGWNFLGNTSFYVINEGLNFILNVFWGVALNAARGIAMQVQSGIASFTGNVITASDPQICKLYAAGEERSMYRLFSLSARSLSLIYITICMPIVISIQPILILWLKEVPPYTGEMVILMLVHGLIRTFHTPITSLFHATAKLKRVELMELFVRTSTVFFAYLVARFLGVPPYSIYVVLCCTEIVNVLLMVQIARGDFHFDIKFYLKEVMMPVSTVIGTLLLVLVTIVSLQLQSYIHWFVLSALLFLLSGVLSLFIGFSRSERSTLINVVTSRFKKK
ncbi:lipopolysaccharide biosynthesis protein [Porphyromonas levii]|uniref:lipopolysaccharide biosynthesis protein n=1 Tax=Porphyromonas levii TaxID=28114 RepID=UPI001B8D5E67|nr:hypothetical protein [Porphyromonas levii]MBR8762943.1 hypothetical protein [Porphyromonas levii]MBR8769049.1 hypothetical protein [Porphyromonas levii]